MIMSIMHTWALIKPLASLTNTTYDDACKKAHHIISKSMEPIMQWSSNVTVGKYKKRKKHKDSKYKPRNKSKIYHHRIKLLGMCLPCVLGVIDSDFIFDSSKSRSVLPISKVRSEVKKVRSEVKKSRSDNNDNIEERQRECSRANHHKHTMVIDSGASGSIIFNQELLENKIKLDSAREFSAGGNDIQFDTMGSLNKVFEYLPLPKDGYYHDQKAVANLISMARAADEFTIKMNTEVDDAIYVFDEQGKYLRFGRTKNNLCAASIGDKDNDSKCYAFNAVKGNKSMFSELDCNGAEAM